MDQDESLVRFEAYLQRRFPERRTPKDYVSDVRQFRSFCSKPWREVAMQDIDAFVDHERQRGLKPATVKRRAAALKTFFDFLAEEAGDLSWINPVRMKRHAGKQSRQLPRDLSDEAIERVWAVIPGARDRAWFALLLRAGLRVGEVASLKLEDLLAPAQADQPARLRVCGKGRKERMVLLSADAYAVLQAWLQERPASPHPEVFLNERDGGPLRANGIEYCLRRYGQQAGVQLTPHQLRHTYARQLIEAGMPLTSLGKLLGHAQVSTTQIYTAGADPELAQAYQQAMHRLSQRPLPLPQANPASLPPPAPTFPVAERERELPNWEAWSPEFPPAIRQAVLSFVQRRLPTWKPSRRAEQAKKVLGEFHRFFRLQLQLRSIQEPGELTLQDLWNYQAQRSGEGVAAHTVDYPLSLVVSLLRELAEQGAAVHPTVFRFRPRARPESLPRHLSLAEAEHLEQYLLERLSEPAPLLRLALACFFVLAHTGIRASECLDLRREDLDLPGRRLIVRQGKGQRDRCVYLSETACQALRTYLATCPLPATAPLFVRPNGRPISYMWLYAQTVALGEAAGVAKVSPHRLRHTLATRLLNAGMEITRIQKLLGHDHINTTLIYARVLDQTVEADYRQAMRQIERQQMPLATTPLAEESWPTQQTKVVKVQEKLDNSV
jgi:site-specific recombinase XerD